MNALNNSKVLQGSSRPSFGKVITLVNVVVSKLDTPPVLRRYRQQIFYVLVVLLNVYQCRVAARSRDVRASCHFWSHAFHTLTSPSAFKMPGTHLLPPNLLKLFAPRPPLPYIRPVGKDIDRVTKKSVSGVGQLLEGLQEAKTVGILSSGEAPDMENGEDSALTYAEETKRQILREERKKQREDQFKVAKDACNAILSFFPSTRLTLLFA